MAYKFLVRGVEVTCESFSELTEAIRCMEETRVDSITTEVPSTGKSEKRAGPQASWDAAKEYAKRHGISTREARMKIAAEKKQEEARKILNNE